LVFGRAEQLLDYRKTDFSSTRVAPICMLARFTQIAGG
jgi:hypothetical protein